MIMMNDFCRMVDCTTAVDPQHLKDFPNCSYVVNRTCQYPINYINKEY